MPGDLCARPLLRREEQIVHVGVLAIPHGNWFWNLREAGYFPKAISKGVHDLTVVCLLNEIVTAEYFSLTGIYDTSPRIVSPELGHPVNVFGCYSRWVRPQRISIDVHDRKVKKHIDALHLSNLFDDLPVQGQPVGIEKAEPSSKIFVLYPRKNPIDQYSVAVTLVDKDIPAISNELLQVRYFDSIEVDQIYLGERRIYRECIERAPGKEFAGCLELVNPGAGKCIDVYRAESWLTG